jgi:hypothetical protein
MARVCGKSNLFSSWLGNEREEIKVLKCIQEDVSNHLPSCHNAPLLKASTASKLSFTEDQSFNTIGFCVETFQIQNTTGVNR